MVTSTVLRLDLLTNAAKMEGGLRTAARDDKDGRPATTAPHVASVGRIAAGLGNGYDAR